MEVGRGPVVSRSRTLRHRRLACAGPAEFGSYVGLPREVNHLGTIGSTLRPTACRRYSNVGKPGAPGAAVPRDGSRWSHQSVGSGASPPASNKVDNAT